MAQISRYQVILMLVWTALGTGIVTMPGTIAHFTVHDAWLACPWILLGGGLCAGVAWIHIRRFPGQTLTQALHLTLGPWAGTCAGVWYAAWIFVSLATIGREVTAFITTAVLPNTPEFVVGLLAIACAGYLVYLGIEVIGRVNQFIMPLAVVVAPLLFGLALRWFDADTFRPVLADGWMPVWRAGIVPAFAYGLEFALSLQWVRALRTPRTLPWDILIAAAVSAFILTLLVALTVGVIGASATYLNYPVLEVVRSVRQGKFIERLDTLYVMGVVTTLVLKLSSFHVSLCQALQDLCRTRDWRWAVFPSALAVWSASFFFFRNLAEVTDFILHVVPAYFLFTVVLLPLVTYAVAAIRGKDGLERRMGPARQGMR